MVAGSNKYIGIGIYSVPDVARLTRLSQHQVRNWLGGYTYRSGGRQKRQHPVLNRQFSKLDDQAALGFLDLIEMRVIGALLEKNFSLQAVRVVHERAQEVFHSEHPFAAARLRVEEEAKEIFSAIDEQLIDVKHKQFAIESFVGPFLDDLDFEDDFARRWWPLREDHSVVIDPARRSGQPIVLKEGVATKILYDSYVAEASVEVVAKWYDVDRESVEGAIAFEQKFAA
jgi:uncharacterized protein (DUF433 family)